MSLYQTRTPWMTFDERMVRIYNHAARHFDIQGNSAAALHCAYMALAGRAFQSQLRPAHRAPAPGVVKTVLENFSLAIIEESHGPRRNAELLRAYEDKAGIEMRDKVMHFTFESLANVVEYRALLSRAPVRPTSRITRPLRHDEQFDFGELVSLVSANLPRMVSG